MAQKTNFQINLKKLCKNKGTTITKVCKELKITYYLLNNAMYGKSKLSPTVSMKLTTYFDCTYEELIGGDQVRPAAVEQVVSGNDTFESYSLANKELFISLDTKAVLDLVFNGKASINNGNKIILCISNELMIQYNWNEKITVKDNIKRVKDYYITTRKVNGKYVKIDKDNEIPF